MSDSSDTGSPLSPNEQIEFQVGTSALRHALPGGENAGGPVVGGGGAGGHYALNTEQIDARAKEVEEVVAEAQHCRQGLQEADNDIKAPAEDKHSQSQAGQAHRSMEAAATHLQGIIDYGTRFAKNLRASAEKYRQAEERGAGEFGKLAE
jgi:flagellar biosynthesis chaperone FliJ